MSVNILMTQFIWMQYIGEGINLVYKVLVLLTALKILDMALTHTNLKAHLAKVKRGVIHALCWIDGCIMRFVDNRNQ